MKTLIICLSLLVLAGCASKEKDPVCSAEAQAEIASWETRFTKVMESSDQKKAAKIWNDYKDKKISEKTANRKAAPYMKKVGPQLEALSAEKKNLMAAHPECGTYWKKHSDAEFGIK